MLVAELTALLALGLSRWAVVGIVAVGIIIFGAVAVVVCQSGGFVAVVAIVLVAVLVAAAPARDGDSPDLEVG